MKSVSAPTLRAEVNHRAVGQLAWHLEKEMYKREYAREALKNGLKLEQKLGTNPYKFGMIGSTDDRAPGRGVTTPVLVRAEVVRTGQSARIVLRRHGQGRCA